MDSMKLEKIHEKPPLYFEWLCSSKVYGLEENETKN